MLDSMTPITHPPRIGLYLISVNRNHYTTAKTLALAGCSVWVRSEVTPGDSRWNAPGIPERTYHSWLFSEPEIEVVADAASAPPVDALLYEIGHDRPRHPQELSAWIDKADYVAAFNTTDQLQTMWSNLRAEVATAIKFRKFLHRTDAVMMQTGSLSFRPTALTSRSIQYGYSVYPRFLRDAALRDLMFDLSYDPSATRPIRIMFAGNASPSDRTKLLQGLETFLKQSSAVRLLRHHSDLGDQKDSEESIVLWMPRFSDDLQWEQSRSAIPLHDLPSTMRQCDFSLCLPGHEPKTHRVPESLLQGSIPILDCPQQFDFDLEDNRNCIVVRNGDWISAVKRVLQMNQEEIRRMRQEVFRVAQRRLHYEKDAGVWLRKLGIEREL